MTTLSHSCTPVNHRCQGRNEAVIICRYGRTMTSLFSHSVAEASLSQRRRPTMRDVAALAGVSLKTVSRVVNDEPNVGVALAERVRAAAAQLSYQPNHTASSLRRSDGRSSTIGLLVQAMSNPFSAAIFRAVADVASAPGLGVLAAGLNEAPPPAPHLPPPLIAPPPPAPTIFPPPPDPHH